MLEKVKNSRAVRFMVGSTLLGVALVVGSTSVAMADPTIDPTADPTGGNGDLLFTTLQNYIQSHLIIGVIALAVIGLVVGLLLRYGRKASHAGG